MNSPIRITNQTWPDSTTPVVSVFNWVYNHKDFIRQSIESILMQETTFPVEIIIQDDASNDGTREIIEEYQNKYPYLFNNILFSENQYSQGKSIMNGLFEKPRGKYIALAHGDDYWTDPLKLQKQVDFLEENEGYSSIFHNVEQRWETLDQASLYLRDKIYQFGSRVNLDQLLGENIVPTCSLLFRKESLYKSINTIPWNQLDYGDWPMVIILATNGSVYYQPMISAVRRMNPTSVWGLQDHKKNILKIFSTRNIIKKSGLLEEKYLVKMKDYEFQLFLQLYDIKESWVFMKANKILGKIKRALDKCSLRYLILTNAKKFKSTLS